MQLKVEKFFSSYQKGFDKFDANAIATHYLLPCHILDVDGRQSFTSEDELIAKFLSNCKRMKALGYYKSKFSIDEIRTLGKDSISVDVAWKVKLATEIYAFRTLYLCCSEVDNWSIFSAVVYDD